MKNLRLAVLLSVISVSLMFQNVFAQDEGHCRFCFKGKPKPDCCSFLIFESGLLFGGAIAGAPPNKDDILLTSDLGAMFNRGKSSALGASLHIAANTRTIRFGAGPRYRKWLNKNIALDVSPRVLVFGFDDSEIDQRFPGFALAAALSVSDVVSIDSYFQVFPYETSTYDSNTRAFNTVKGTEKGIYFGLSGRSSFAPIIQGTAGLIVLALSAMNSSDWRL